MVHWEMASWFGAHFRLYDEAIADEFYETQGLRIL